MIDVSSYHLFLCSCTHGITLNKCAQTRHTFQTQRFMDAHAHRHAHTANVHMQTKPAVNIFKTEI